MGMMMTNKQQATELWFTQAFTVEARKCAIPTVPKNMLRVRTHCSAISAGTEMLVYRGQLPQDMALDANLPGMHNEGAYPLQYGYACVGVVEALGVGVDPRWRGKRVFAFAPHASHFIASPESLIAIPNDVTAEDAVFLANMETAVNLVQDGKPGVGERVVVLGQGVVGLLLSGVLSQHPLESLEVVDAIATRRSLAQQLGAHSSSTLEQSQEQDADLIYEVSGVPAMLNTAIAMAGYCSRIVIGSWYGTKTAAIDLGGRAHRNRLHIITSQVSSIAPELSARWSKQRRFAVAWEMLRRVKPQRLISHRVKINDAEQIYKQLHEAPVDILQAIFVYE